MEAPVGPQRPQDKALFEAIDARDIAAVRRALDAGASPNARKVGITHPNLEKRDPGGKRYFGESVLMAMVQSQNELLVRLLIEGGADVNAPGPGGETPLMVQPTDDNLPILRLLLARGAKVNQANNRGGTALTLAAHYDAIEAMKLLLRAGADINAGRPTPLMSALNSPTEPTIAFLLKHGANPNIRLDGETALDRAEVNSPIWKLIVRAGGKGLSAAQRKKQEEREKQEEKSYDYVKERKRERSAFIASLPQRDIGWIPEDNAVLEAFLLDIPEYSRQKDMALSNKEGPIFIKENSSPEYFSWYRGFGNTDEQEVDVTLELRASLVVRNQTPRKLTALPLPHKDLQFKDVPRTGFPMVPGRKGDPRLWLTLSMPGYSRDHQTAVVDFLFGPSPHGARGTWLMKKQSGKWVVQWRAITMYP